jgi:hypothetical protein
LASPLRVQEHDLTGAELLLADLDRRTVVIADKAYDADRLRTHLRAQGAIANTPNMFGAKNASVGAKRRRWLDILFLGQLNAPQAGPLFQSDET